jgi:hypothetical protein
LPKFKCCAGRHQQNVKANKGYNPLILLTFACAKTHTYRSVAHYPARQLQKFAVSVCPSQSVHLQIILIAGSGYAGIQQKGIIQHHGTQQKLSANRY